MSLIKLTEAHYVEANLIAHVLVKYDSGAVVVVLEGGGEITMTATGREGVWSFADKIVEAINEGKK